MCADWEKRRNVTIFMMILLAVLNVLFAHLCETSVREIKDETETVIIAYEEEMKIEERQKTEKDVKRIAQCRRIFLVADIACNTLAYALYTAAFLLGKLRARKKEAYYVFRGHIILSALALLIGGLILHEEFSSLQRFILISTAMIILVCLRLYLAPKILDEEATDVSDVAAIEREEWFREKVSKRR